jgi:hypothetical protein
MWEHSVIRAARVFLVVVCVASVLMLPREARGLDDEYRVKASVLYNLAKFVDWPQSAFPAVTTPVTLCVLGSDPFGAPLDEAFHGRQVGGRSVLIRRDASIEPGCHILFVARSERKRRAAVLDRVSTSPVLTVGEDEGFSAAGGIIELVTDNQEIRLSINNGAAQRAGLRVSARLLSLASQHGWLDVSR